MGKPSDIYLNNDTDIKVQTYNGFSFPAFFLSMTWSFTKGLYIHGFILLFFKLLPFIIILITSKSSFRYIVKDDDTYSYALIWNMVLLPAYIVFGLKGNDWVKENLVRKGYKRLISDKQGSDDASNSINFNENESSNNSIDINVSSAESADTLSQNENLNTKESNNDESINKTNVKLKWYDKELILILLIFLSSNSFSNIVEILNSNPLRIYAENIGMLFAFLLFFIPVLYGLIRSKQISRLMKFIIFGIGIWLYLYIVFRAI